MGAFAGLSPFRPAAILLVCALAGVTRSAAAFNVYKVDPACVAQGAFPTIQQAVDAAAANPGEDYVWISNDNQTKTYSEHVVISDPDGVIIEGGFTTCDDFDPGTGTTTISGASNGGTPVFDISGNSHVYLGNLNIQGANTTFGGGGIRFFGAGDLTIAATHVTDNTANYGGGIYFQADGGPATLTLLASTYIVTNTASGGGGGIYVSGTMARLLMLSPNTYVAENQAAFDGGGVFLYGARADIGAPAAPGVEGVISGNHTDAYGGGIALEAGAVARIFPHDAAHPSAIQRNSAALLGGGIYAHDSDICLFNPTVIENTALKGAAIYQAGAGGTYINTGFPSRLGDECGPETVSALGGEHYYCTDSNCGSISSNAAIDALHDPTGPIIYQQDGELIATRVRVQNNLGTLVLQTKNTKTDISSCLVTDNIVSDTLIRIDGVLAGTASLGACTFAHDAITGTHVFDFLNGAAPSLQDDIIAEPGRLSVSTSSPFTANYVMSNDISTLPHSGNPTVVAGDPRFVSVSFPYDYHLRGTSPAIDFAPAVVDVDLDLLNRGIDLPQIVNKFGPTDLGAYESQVAFACDPNADALFCDGFEP